MKGANAKEKNSLTNGIENSRRKRELIKKWEKETMGTYIGK